MKIHPCLFLGVLAAAASVSVSDASANQTIIWNYNGDSHWIRIDEPVVTAARTVIPFVVYGGDRIWVRAGGCVQTGGSGKTWKRYVNPSGPNPSWLYHGQIQIPGAVESLTNLSDNIVGANGSWSREFTIGVANPNFPPKTIAIGYTDDNYSDNGYWGHDPGTDNQCEGVENAWLEIYVCRSAPSHGPTC